MPPDPGSAQISSDATPIPFHLSTIPAPCPLRKVSENCSTGNPSVPASVTEAEAKEWFALRPDKERTEVLKDASGVSVETGIK